MLDGFAFLYGFEVRMGVGGAVVFLLYFFKGCALYFMHVAAVLGLLFVLLSLEISHYLLLDGWVCFWCPGNVIFHGACSWHTFKCIPSLPFSLGYHLPNSRFIGFAIPDSSLFVVCIELQFGLVTHLYLSFWDKLGRQVKYLFEWVLWYLHFLHMVCLGVIFGIGGGLFVFAEHFVEGVFEEIHQG